MRKLYVGCLTLATAWSVVAGSESRADFAYATVEVGEVETVFDSDGPGKSVSAKHDAPAGAGYTAHGESTASITSDSAGRPSFHLRLLSEYSAPQFSFLSSIFSRASVSFSDTVTFIGQDVGSQIYGYVDGTAEGVMTATGIGSRGTVDFIDEFGNAIQNIDSRFHPGAILQYWSVPITLNGSNGVYTGSFSLTVNGYAQANETGKADVDFSHTINFSGISFFDSSFNPLTGQTFSSLGYRYNGSTDVPVPGAIVLLISGAPCMAGYLLMRVRSRRPESIPNAADR